MRSSMRTITNVSIDNRAVDCAREGYSFVINSDHISYLKTEYWDIDTRQYYAWTVGDGVTSDWGRGDKITLGLSGSFTAGRDYMGVITIYQRQAGDMSEETSTGNYNVYMGAGKLQDDSSTATEVYIDKDISFFRSPVYRNNNTVLAGGCVLRLSDRDLLISAYNPTTGKATVTGAKINGVTSSTRTTSKGESYKLITNYLICDAFVFYYRTTPTLSITCELTADGISAVGTYSQAEGTEIQSWKMWLEYSEANMTKTKLVHETHYNTTIQDTFPVFCTNGYDLLDPDDPAEVNVYLEVTTQDGVTVQAVEELELSARYPLTVTIDNLGGISAEGLPSGKLFFYRQQKTNEVYSLFTGRKYIGASETGSISNIEQGYGTTYRYIVCGIDEDGNLYQGISNSYIDPAKYWSIEHITKIGYNTYRHDGNARRFMVDVNPAQIETVLGGTAYSTEGRFPKYIHGSDRYDTGSFTAVLGTIQVPEASINDIENWAEYISQKGLFLLKTDSGDVKIVAITGNPARQYGTSLEEIGITRVTYNWTEMADINEVVVE